MDWSSPGSSVHGIFQAVLLKWLPVPPPGDLPNPGIEPKSPVSSALAGVFFTTKPFLSYFSVQQKLTIYMINLYNIINQLYFDKKTKLKKKNNLSLQTSPRQLQKRRQFYTPDNCTYSKSSAIASAAAL